LLNLSHIPFIFIILVTQPCQHHPATMVSHVDIDIDELIEKVISNPPSPPKTYLLQFEDIHNAKGLFEFCMEVFTKLSKRKYGDASGKVNIASWTPQTLTLINEYFMSMGFKFNVHILEPNDPNMAIYNSLKYGTINITPRTQLSNIVYMLTTPVKVYVIYFDYLV